MLSASQKQMDDYRAKQMSKNRARDLENQRLLEEAMKKKVDIKNISKILLTENASNSGSRCYIFLKCTL